MPPRVSPRSLSSLLQPLQRLRRSSSALAQGLRRSSSAERRKDKLRRGPSLHARFPDSRPRRLVRARRLGRHGPRARGPRHGARAPPGTRAARARVDARRRQILADHVTRERRPGGDRRGGGEPGRVPAGHDRSARVDENRQRSRHRRGDAGDDVHRVDQPGVPRAVRRVRRREVADALEGAADRAEHFCIDRFEYPNRKGGVPDHRSPGTRRALSARSVGKRLCTEDEWTFACEGEDALPYPYGLHPRRDGLRHRPTVAPVDERLLAPARQRQRPWPRSTSLWQGEPSGSRPRCRSPFGVYDMTGNVDEWTRSCSARASAPDPQGRLLGPVRTRCRASTRAHDERPLLLPARLPLLRRRARNGALSARESSGCRLQASVRASAPPSRWP